MGVSVIVLTYNSKLEKLLYTLESIVSQKNIEFEIIISDDGSTDNHYAEIQDFFKNRNFNRYVFLPNSTNLGTVANCIRGVETGKMKYVKAISPGDILLGDTSLASQVEVLDREKNKWLFTETLYTQELSKQQITIASHVKFVQSIEAYITQDVTVARYNIIEKGERPAAIATFFEREFFLEYLKKVSIFAKYAEDLSYFLMALDGFIPTYYNSNTVLYEYGTGISTSGNTKWREILKNEVDGIMKYIKDTKEYKSLLVDYSKYYNSEDSKQHHKHMSGLQIEDTELTELSYKECCVNAIERYLENPKKKKIWIYGAGFGGKVLLQTLEEYGIGIEGFVDKNAENIKSLNGYSVVNIENVDVRNVHLMITLLERSKKFESNLMNWGIDETDYSYITAEKVYPTLQSLHY